MKRISSIATIFALLTLSNLAKAATSVPLNTAWGYWTSLVYSPFPGAVSITKDAYWINISSFPTTTPPIGSSFFINTTGTPWAPAMTYTSGGVSWGSDWISAWSSNPSQPGTTLSNPSYTIFRKYFVCKTGSLKQK
jgi:hypothetical protein